MSLDRQHTVDLDDPNVDRIMRHYRPGNADLYRMMRQEAINRTLLEHNRTFRHVYNVLMEEENVRLMIRAILEDRPPFEAVVVEIERICDTMNSDLSAHREVDHWRCIHTSFGKVVSYVMSLCDIHPQQVFDEKGNVIPGRYKRKKLRAGTQFGTAVVFAIPADVQLGDNH